MSVFDTLVVRYWSFSFFVETKLCAKASTLQYKIPERLLKIDEWSKSITL
jgi:hypothetical protein